MEATFQEIFTTRESRVEVITLNRPEKLNAWTQRMRHELTQAIGACNDDPDVGAMVITGAGRGFCAGADIGRNFKSRIEGEDSEQEKLPPPEDWVRLLRDSKPMIAAVNGASVGVGLTMIMPCDVIIASDRAKFGMFFVRMGVVPELASSHFAVARMGFGRASEMCLTGRLYSAQEAFDYRLVDRLVSADELLESAIALGNEIAANPARQLAWTKELLTLNASESDLGAVQKREAERLQLAYQSPEHARAVAKFMGSN